MLTVIIALPEIIFLQCVAVRYSETSRELPLPFIPLLDDILSYVKDTLMYSRRICAVIRNMLEHVARCNVTYLSGTSIFVEVHTTARIRAWRPLFEVFSAEYILELITFTCEQFDVEGQLLGVNRFYELLYLPHQSSPLVEAEGDNVCFAVTLPE